jgi:ribulose-phosphate 3-epimerase
LSAGLWTATNKDMPLPLIAASVMAADTAYLADEITAVTAANVDIFHWDIMDGHFVPNFTFGPAVVKELRPHTDVPFDIHLLVTNPSAWLDIFIDAGANAISFHIEAENNPMQLIEKLKQNNIQAGLVFNPETQLDIVSDDIFNALDRVVIMTVKPGFGGQAFIDQTAKIKTLAQKFPHLDIMVDGGINAITAPQAIAAGATTLVSGSALFNSDNRKAFINTLKGNVA